MNKVIKLAAIACMSFSLVGCGKASLDTSSEEAMDASMNEIMAELPKSDQQKFTEALAGIYMVNFMANMNKPQDETKAEVNKTLDGKTAEEIIAMGEELKDKVKTQMPF